MDRQTPHSDEGKKGSRGLGDRIKSNQTKGSSLAAELIIYILPKCDIENVTTDTLNIEKNHIRIVVPSDRSREHIANADVIGRVISAANRIYRETKPKIS
jgi:hypothetical protein